MSKRRQTIAAISTRETDKRTKTEEAPQETEDLSNTSVADLSDKQLKQCLADLGENIGPISITTRSLYERLLTKHRAAGESSFVAPAKSNTSISSKANTSVCKTETLTPKRPSKISLKTSTTRKKNLPTPPSPDDPSPEALLSPDFKPPKLVPTEKRGPSTVDIDTLPDPPFVGGDKITRTPQRTPKNGASSSGANRPSSVDLEKLTDKQIRERLQELGETPGPVTNKTRNMYLELLRKHQNGGLAKGFAGRRVSRASKEEALSSTRIDEEAPPTSAAMLQNVLEDYPEEEDEEEMDTANQDLCVSYVKTPYRKTRHQICRAEFETLDFVAISGSPSPSCRPSHFMDLKNRGVQAVITHPGTSNLTLINVTSAARGQVAIYAGVNLMMIREGRLATTQALQAGADAIVFSFPDTDSLDAQAIALAIKQVMDGHLTISYFYNHSRNTNACPVKISKHLLGYKNGYQGIFASLEEQTLVELEALSVKIYETNCKKMLTALGHGIGSFASHEAMIAMPVIRAIKEEFYEGNISESLRLQAILNRFTVCLRKHGPFLPSLHATLTFLGREPGELHCLARPLSPTQLDTLHKDLNYLTVKNW